MNTIAETLQALNSEPPGAHGRHDDLPECWAFYRAKGLARIVMPEIMPGGRYACSLWRVTKKGTLRREAYFAGGLSHDAASAETARLAAHFAALG